eukprot:5947210-Pleurochrysis_carterae.AAC.2
MVLYVIFGDQLSMTSLNDDVDDADVSRSRRYAIGHPSRFGAAAARFRRASGPGRRQAEAA